MSVRYSDLDDAFLRYIQATPENLRRIQRFYVPFFAACQGLVVDLACGHGDFAQLLAEHGVEVLGVDSDRSCCAESRQRGINIVCNDVFDYLQQVEEDSLAGVFSAHLVEHLTYQQVMELIRLSHRALKEGGIIVLVTPNVRGLYPHLESFYMHFGHVAFYHPRLLSFFLDYLGFSNPRAGENPNMAHPLWHNVPWSDPGEMAAGEDPDLGGAIEQPSGSHLVRYDVELPSQYRGAFGRLVSVLKMFAVREVVQPLLDRVVHGVNENLDRLYRALAYQQRYVGQLNTNARGTHERLMALDRAVECYVYATKGDTVLDLPPELVGKPL